MAPLEARYFVNGEKQVEVTAEDGVPIVLNTPVGFATGELDLKTRDTLATFDERFSTEFPGQLPYKGYQNISETNPTEGAGEQTITRSKKYRTIEGDVEIKFKAIDTLPDETDKTKKRFNFFNLFRRE